ncbi:hypothetical protein PoB_000603900, partial [Plakobranchus ocellatus]
MGSAGDNKDNDCDGQRDEDDCSQTVAATRDCPAEVTGDLDIYGTSFTFLIPDHCSDNISLLVMSDTVDSFQVTVKTPL